MSRSLSERIVNYDVGYETVVGRDEQTGDLFFRRRGSADWCRFDEALRRGLVSKVETRRPCTTVEVLQSVAMLVAALAAMLLLVLFFRVGGY